MPLFIPATRRRAATVSGILLVLCIPWSAVRAGRDLDEHRPADPQGSVEIVNVAGSVEVSGWDRPEIAVSGSTGDGVERVDLSSEGSRSSIRVVPRAAGGWRSNSAARLIVHVPVRSSLRLSLVSANLKISGVQGAVTFQTMSGDASGEVGGDLHANTVSGNVRLTARAAKAIEVRTISGDIQLTGGGGEVDISTVTGDAKIELTTLTRGRFKTVSGDLTAALALGPEARLEGESVSGDLHLEFAGEPAAEFDVQSFSGGIKNCFGPKPTEPRYGPGSRLEFKSGDGRGRVRVDTKSGDVQLCTKGAPRQVSLGSRLAFPYLL